MNTKNIFRTLFMAVLLLVGASSAKADETTIWTGPNDPYSSINIENTKFSDITVGSKVRFYFSSLNSDYWCYKLNSNWQTNLWDNWEGESWEGAQTISKHNSTNNGIYTDLEVSREGITLLKANGLSIWQQGVVFEKITIVSGSDDSGNTGGTDDGGSTLNGEIELWAGSAYLGNYWEIKASLFAGATTTSKIRVYVDGDNRIYLVAGNNNWGKMWGNTDEFQGSPYYNSTDKCYEFTIGEFLSTIKANGLYIQSKGATITKVTLINGDGNTEEGDSGNTGGSGDVTYDVKIPDWMKTGVTVTVDREKAKANETVTLTVKPNEGYRVTWVSVQDDNYQNVNVESKGNNIYQFTMPANNVTVNVSYEEVSYSVSISSTSNGSVTANSTSVKAGETVTLTVRPDDGYELGTLSVKDANGNDIAVNNNQFTMPASDVTVSATFTPLAPPVEAVIGPTGYATFCSAENLDFRKVTGVKAYYAKEVSDGVVTLVQVTGTVAAGRGLVLVGNAGRYSVPVASSGNTISGNLLVGVSTNTNVKDANKYVLTVENSVVKFASTANQTASVPAGHAYLDLSRASSRAYSRIVVTFSGETTGIADRTLIDQEPNVYYDLRGMRVEKPTHGLYIINGKKVFVK